MILFICVNKKQYSKVNSGQYYLEDMCQVAAPMCRCASLFVKRETSDLRKKIGSIEAVEYIEADGKSMCCGLAS